jgi:hypothetical protein
MSCAKTSFLTEAIFFDFFYKIDIKDCFGNTVSSKNFKNYLKYEQQCFIGYKNTRRSRVSLGLIKHELRMF